MNKSSIKYLKYYFVLLFYSLSAYIIYIVNGSVVNLIAEIKLKKKVSTCLKSYDQSRFVKIV